jgi:SpoVK/Ycf46/Vps4 family AAA+-type ATPase
VASINKLSKLFGALSEQNVLRAEEIAADIVKDEEHKGHHGAARLLKGSLHPNGGNGSSARNGYYDHPVFGRLLSEALSPQVLTTHLSDVSLRPTTRAELHTVIKEWRNHSALEAAGIPRRSRLFFHGPPGCGKSLTAKALGLELSLPTFIVRFDGVIGAYLGQTAIHLRELFRFAERSPCVLMFDEVDALGKRRGNPMDVGELDRVVIAFMQELEHSVPAGIVIATSNLPSQLDLALWRRFDLILPFPAPTKSELSSFAKALVAKHELPPSAQATKRALRAKSYAEAERLIQAEARERILANCEAHHAKRRRKR